MADAATFTRPPRLWGRVSHWRQDAGWGHAIQTDPQVAKGQKGQIFIHHANFVECRGIEVTLKEGQYIEFERGNDGRGRPEAKYITQLKGVLFTGRPKPRNRDQARERHEKRQRTRTGWEEEDWGEWEGEEWAEGEDAAAWSGIADEGSATEAPRRGEEAENAFAEGTEGEPEDPAGSASAWIAGGTGRGSTAKGRKGSKKPPSPPKGPPPRKSPPQASSSATAALSTSADRLALRGAALLRGEAEDVDKTWREKADDLLEQARIRIGQLHGSTGTIDLLIEDIVKTRGFSSTGRGDLADHGREEVRKEQDERRLEDITAVASDLAGVKEFCYDIRRYLVRIDQLYEEGKKREQGAVAP